MDEYLPVSEQLQVLFHEVKQPSGIPYTLKDVSEATGVSLPTLSQLRTGRIGNPQLSTLRAICHFFNVPLTYFDTRTVEECYLLIAQGRLPASSDHTQTQVVARMVAALTPQRQRDVLTLIRWAQAAEQQADVESIIPRLNDDT